MKLCHAVCALHTGCQPIGWCLSAVWNSLWRKSNTCLDVSFCLWDWWLTFILWAAVVSGWGILLDEMVAEVKHSGELQWTVEREAQRHRWLSWCLGRSTVCLKDWDKLFIKSMNDMIDSTSSQNNCGSPISLNHKLDSPCLIVTTVASGKAYCMATVFEVAFFML